MTVLDSRKAGWLVGSRSARAKAEIAVPGAITVALMLLWAAHNGGFDADTWYWGALLLLAVLSSLILLQRRPFAALSTATRVALAALALYVAWSYASITWAAAPGVALTGSNRALLYLLVFGVMTVIPWRAGSARAAVLTFALGIGVMALIILLRLASADDVVNLIRDGRLQAPTGYNNSTAALFTIGALMSTALASRRELPGLVRGLLIGSASACLPLAVAAQSRGWLFTLPVVLLVTLLVVRARLLVVAAALLPAAAVLLSARSVVAIFDAHSLAALDAASRSAGQRALVCCVTATVIGTVLAWLEGLRPPRTLTTRGRVRLGGVLAALTLAALAFGGFAATHGEPLHFIKRQWNGFSHVPTAAAHGSYFATVGSGRYDFWRVALDGFAAHPIGGLGQDNFADYYVTRRRTPENPAWVHSLELRLLAHTGAVGFLLFMVFLTAAFAAALRARRIGPEVTRSIAGVSMIASVVWLVHGSVDWFWELPALTAPALGFLAMAGALTRRPALLATNPASDRHRRPVRLQLRSVVAGVMAALVIIAGTAALAFPYLAVREISIASDLSTSKPSAALIALGRAAQLDPLNAEAGTDAGLIALAFNQPTVAKQRFAQSIDREPGAWLPWLGKGLAESALGERPQAAQALRHAYTINNKQPPIKIALRRVFSAHPLTYSEAVPLFVVAR